MNFPGKKFLAAVLVVFSMQLTSCQTKTSAGGKLTADVFEQKLKEEKNAQLIDVRTPEEYASGYIKGAQNIDWNSDDFETGINKLSKSKPVFVYCLSGGRSSAAAAALQKLGFAEVYDLQGGMMAWNNSGKEVVSSDAVTTKKGLSTEEYAEKIKSDKLVLVDFYAPWCAPCKKMAPMLEELANEQKNKIEFVKINADDNKELAASLKITDLPVLLLYKNEKVVWQSTGLTEKTDINTAIKKN